MARLARMVIPGVPHHVTQRGNRRERIFFEAGDERIYLDLNKAATRTAPPDRLKYVNFLRNILWDSSDSAPFSPKPSQRPRFWPENIPT